MISNKETKQQMLSDVEKPVLKSRMISNNTVKIWYEDGTIAVRLHHTDVVTFLTDGTIQLNTGGWYTPTTKDRINAALSELSGYRYHLWIYQENSKWYIEEKGGKTSLFYDGITLNKDLKIVKPKSEDKGKDKLLKAIKGYCDKIKKLKKIPLPETGDCLICRIETGLTDVEYIVRGNHDKSSHLRLHLKEGYIHGSLLYNALKWAGFNPEFYLQYVNMDGNEYLRKTIVRSVKRYLRTNLGIPC